MGSCNNLVAFYPGYPSRKGIFWKYEEQKEMDHPLKQRSYMARSLNEGRPSPYIFRDTLVDHTYKL